MSPGQRAAIGPWLGTLALAAVAGAGAQALHSPLPWLIGPLLATAAASMLGLPTRASQRLRNLGLWLLGSTLGLYFTPEVVQVVARIGPLIGVGVVWALLLGYGFYRWLRYWTASDGTLAASAFFAGAIGGASEMALLADRHKAQVDRVAAAHSLRVMIVVVLIPFLLKAAGAHGADPVSGVLRVVDPAGLALLLAATAAGTAAMALMRTPNPWVLGALAVSAMLTASGISLSGMPKALSGLAQLAIGVALGVRFTPVFIRSAPRWMVAVATGTLLMIVVSAGFGALLGRLAGLHPATMLLATSPGGIAEMAITASVLALGAPVVTAFHVVRYVSVLVLTEPLWRLEQRRLARRADAGVGAQRPG